MTRALLLQKLFALAAVHGIASNPLPPVTAPRAAAPLPCLTSCVVYAPVTTVKVPEPAPAYRLDVTGQGSLLVDGVSPYTRMSAIQAGNHLKVGKARPGFFIGWEVRF